jgi:acyl-CoA synthetase (AMP-forming)/AMP-acid ligase II
MLDELLRGADATPAIVSAGGDVLDYAALRAAARRMAGELGDLAGSAVAIAVRDPSAAVIAILGTFAAGGVPFPLDVRSDWRPIADRARPAARVTAAGVERAEPGSLPAGAGLLLATSGSTGAAKIVVLGAAGVLANIDAILDYLPVRDFPRTAVVLPLHYTYALVGQTLATLRAGATVLALADVPYPVVQLERMAALGARGLSAVPTSLRLLARATLELGAPPCLGYVGSAGARLDAGTVADVRAAFPGARIFNQWGLTEAGPRVAALADDDLAFAGGAVGRPLPGVTVEAIEGELCVRGPSVMLGYLDDPAATARALGPHGLRTGDIGRVEDGRVYVTGRADRVVKIAGEKVSLDEIEAVLADCCEACVVAVADEVTGARTVAFLAGVSSPAEAQALVRARLPPLRRPRRWIVLPALPRTPSGKVDLDALRRAAAERDG